ncbi:MAG: class I SAM-dependent methyltransferase [Planctomycetota bacterium]
MESALSVYRWNTDEAAAAFDAAAQHIHPLYTRVQDQLLELLAAVQPRLVVDLGGGPGRLLERVLRVFQDATVVLVDQSEAFLGIAERRLHAFGDRARLVHARVQDDWPAQIGGRPDAILSMSAIHHLEPTEKQGLYRRCADCLAPGGLLANGDECRPESDADYLAELLQWAADKDERTAEGLIPREFDGMFQRWYERNIEDFGGRRVSGDDCHETAEAQLEYYRQAGLSNVRTAWHERLWAVLAGEKPR